MRVGGLLRLRHMNPQKICDQSFSLSQKAHDILKKAWNAEGSPFKGTPFDPSRVQIAGSW